MSSHVEEGAFPLEDLLGATEAFLASTVREVQAISAIDETELPAMPRRADPGGGERIRRCPRAGARGLILDLSLSLDFQLTDEQRLISESAREFCDKEIAPRVRDNDRAGRFDRELASKLGEMGYLGAPVSEEYGGRSLDYLSYALIVEQVGRVDSSARTVVSRPDLAGRRRRSSAGGPRSRSGSGSPGSAPVRRSAASP